MPTKLSKTYDPAATEAKLYERWEKSGAFACDVTRQGAARKPRSEKIDDVGIAKQVVEKRFHCGGRVRPAQLE